MIYYVSRNILLRRHFFKNLIHYSLMIKIFNCSITIRLESFTSRKRIVFKILKDEFEFLYIWVWILWILKNLLLAVHEKWVIILHIRKPYLGHQRKQYEFYCFKTFQNIPFSAYIIVFTTWMSDQSAF